MAVLTEPQLLNHRDVITLFRQLFDYLSAALAGFDDRIDTSY